MNRKFILFLLTIGLAILLIPVPNKNKTFSLEAISAGAPFKEAWEGRAQNDGEKKETETALSQSYRFLGGGGQCFSFVSQDGKYVIKFFKQKAFQPPRWLKNCPLPFLLEKKVRKRNGKRDRVFFAFKFCFNRLCEETGILYVHLNPTQHLHKTLVFCDASGKDHLLNLDELQFVIQKKADLANHRLDTLIANKNLDGAKQAIDQLLSLSGKLHQKGVHNRDPNFRNNYGFVDAQPMIVDVGRIGCSERSKEEDLHHFTVKFRIYLANQHPELLEYFDQSVLNMSHLNK